MSIKKERNIEREKTAIDNLTYGTDKFKKQDEMLIVGLTKKQKSDFKYERYKKAVRDDNVKEVFPDESIFELRKMFERMMEETGGRRPKD